MPSHDYLKMKEAFQLKARETIFFYNIEGELKQAVEVESGNDTSLGQLEVVISAEKYGSCSTKINSLAAGDNKFTCYAPVVYPNLIGGVHRPVIADIEVYSAGKNIYKGTVEIGKHRPWTIFVCQDVCSDYTWGMPFDQTKNVSAEFTQEHLNYMLKTDGLRENMKHRWNMNQTAEVEWFEECRDSEEVKEFYKRVKEGRLEISATYNSNLSSMLGTEQAIRSLYYARELWEKRGVSLDTLEHMEMPTITWGMISIYAKAGLKYFTKAWYDFVNKHLRKFDNIPLFYWEGPDGSRLLSFMPPGPNSKAHYMQARFLISSPYKAIVDELHNWWIPQFEGTDSYPYNSFMLLGAYGDLHASSKYSIDTFIENMTRYDGEPWEYPKLVNSTWRQFFGHVAAHAAEHGIPIPVVRGDMGTSWETWPAHYAHVAAKVKHGADDFIAAEKLAAIKSLFEGKINSEAAGMLKSSMKLMNLLAEHPWNGTNEDERYRSYEKRRDWADELEYNNRRVAAAFTGGVERGSGKKPAGVSALNLMSWNRTDEVVIDTLEYGQQDKPAGYNWQKIEEFGKEKHVFIAENMPAMGFAGSKCGGNHISDNNTSIKIVENVIENDFYKIVLSRFNGSIISLWDKKNNCELVSEKEGIGINQFICNYEGSRRILGNVKITQVNCGPLRASLMIEGESRGCRVVSVITLYGSIDKIFIANRIIKDPDNKPVNIYFAFPFNVPGREYHYDCAGSIMKPGLLQYGGDQMKGAGQEVYSVRNFLDASNSSMGVVLSPCDSYLFQLGNMNDFGTMPDFPNPDNATVYSLVMTNHHYELLGNQGHNKDFCFRYAIKTHKGGYDAVNAMRFGMGQNNPLLAVHEFDCGNMLCEGESLITCKNDNVIITAFKNSENNDGSYMLRLWEIKGEDCEAEIDVSKAGFSKACICDIIERETGVRQELYKGRLTVKMKAMAIETVKLYK